MGAVTHTRRDDVPFGDVMRRLKILETNYINPDTAASAYIMAPRGLVDEHLLDTSSVSYGTTTNADMLINNVPMIANRRYLIHLHTQVTWTASAAGAIATMQLKVDTVDVRRFWTFRPNYVTTDAIFFVDSWVEYTPTATDTYDLRLSWIAVTGSWGAILNGDSSSNRWLRCYDAGGVV